MRAPVLLRTPARVHLKRLTLRAPRNWRRAPSAEKSQNEANTLKELGISEETAARPRTKKTGNSTRISKHHPRETKPRITQSEHIGRPPPPEAPNHENQNREQPLENKRCMGVKTEALTTQDANSIQTQTPIRAQEFPPWTHQRTPLCSTSPASTYSR